MLAIYVEVDPSAIDVNVHPTKTELRFLESQSVFHKIDSLIEKMIATRGAPAFAAGGIMGAQSPHWQVSQTQSFSGFGQFAPSQQEPMPGGPLIESAVSPNYLEKSPEKSFADSSGAVPHPFSRNHFSGVIFNTYLIYDLGAELALVDQHAADERIRYERFRSRVLRESETQSQALLIPEAVHFQADLQPELKARLHWLEKMGFEVEIFGEDSLLSRAIPVEWGMGNFENPPEKSPRTRLFSFFQLGRRGHGREEIGFRRIPFRAPRQRSLPFVHPSWRSVGSPAGTGASRSSFPVPTSLELPPRAARRSPGYRARALKSGSNAVPMP